MSKVYFQEGIRYIPHHGRETTRSILSAAKRAGNGRYAIIWMETEEPDVYERMIREFAQADTIQPGETYLYVKGTRLKIDLRGTGEVRFLYRDRLISSTAVVKDEWNA